MPEFQTKIELEKTLAICGESNYTEILPVEQNGGKLSDRAVKWREVDGCDRKI